MMSDDEDTTCRYGTALPELPADVIPTKKPITVADQIAVDSNGKRRFHGAFTGGFSAGFWNTVGSLEGWKPQAFKSSRTEKAQRLSQAPTDFMDDEDIGEFGIAPQRIQTTEDFTAKPADKESRKRPAQSGEGPVLGTPVLQLFLKPAKDKASVSLLKKMGWREQTGIGSRQTKSEKKKAAKRFLEERGGARVYNVDMGPFQKPIEETEDDDAEEAESDDSDEEITFAPDDYEPFLQAFKTNRFGLGYEGLSKTTGTTHSQHVNLFAPFEVVDKKNKKLSITGQAFGVGAFEEDDDDIYARDDLTRYDFSLGGKAKSAAKKQIQPQSSNIIEGFAVSKSQQKRMNKKIFTIDLPSSFTPRNWALRKTRFGPAIIPTNSSPPNDGHKRHMLTAEERGKLLNDDKEQPIVVESKSLSVLNEQSADIETNSGPQSIAHAVDIVKIEPIEPTVKSLTRQKAPNFIKLPESLNFDRFVSEKDLVAVKEEKVKEEPKKFEVKRTKWSWAPCSLLYEKMNIAEPTRGSNKKSNKGGTNFSLFQCLSETTKNRKKTYRERADLTDTFTNAKKPDDDLSNTNANIISIPSITVQSTSTITPELMKPSIPSPPSTSIPSTSVRPSIAKQLEPQAAKPKTELEIKSLTMTSKHPADKKDLFRAIFDSDEEDLDEIEPRIEPNDDIAPNVSSLQSQVITNVTVTQTTSILNILRNTSPPRGIFSHMFAPKSTTKNASETTESLAKQSVEEKGNIADETNLLYGPSLPVVKSISDSMIIDSAPIISSAADDWVEKSEIADHGHKKKNKKKDKKIKKHKKDKTKKSKHKSKERNR